jgi:NAD(P)-dependent dehydrogenase (short-subunit alcohol dehydrogenase family)
LFSDGLNVLVLISVSNAAVNPFFGPILHCPEATWDKIFEINVKTAFLLFKGRLFRQHFV